MAAASVAIPTGAKQPLILKKGARGGFASLSNMNNIYKKGARGGFASLSNMEEFEKLSLVAE